MSSYQQISIPASHPYSKNFPDESESGSSQLQVPLNKNNQQDYPSGPLNQPGQFYSVGQDYNQPAQLIVAGNPMPLDPKRKGLQMKIKDLEENLDSGLYMVYKVWLYFCIFCSVLGILQVFFGFLGCIAALITANDTQESTAVMSILAIIFLVFGSCCIWRLQHLIIMKNAMTNKSLEGARRGLKSMNWYAVYSLGVCLVLIIIVECSKMVSPKESQEESWAVYYVQAFMVGYAVPTFLILFGARQVVSLLAEREALISDFNTSSSAIMA